MEVEILKMNDIELLFNNGLTENQKIIINEIVEWYILFYESWQAYLVKTPEMVEYLNTENTLQTIDKRAYYFYLLEFYLSFFSRLSKYYPSLVPQDLNQPQIKSLIENYQTEQKELTTDSGDIKYIFCNEVLQSFSKFDGLLWEKLNNDWFRLEQPKPIELKCTLQIYYEYNKENKKNQVQTIQERLVITQPMFIYFFDKYLDKNLCKSPTDWLPLIFTKAFNYTNQRNALKVLQAPINKNDKKSKSFNEFKVRFDSLNS